MTNTAIQVRTGTSQAGPNYRIKSTSASLGIVTSSLLINGTVTIEAWDHTSGRRIHVDFCNPHQTITPASTQAERMRMLADTLLREAERLERLIEQSKADEVCDRPGCLNAEHHDLSA